MLLAQAIAANAEVGPLVIGGVVVSVSGALAYFIRRSFEEFGHKLDGVVTSVQAHSVSLATMALEVAHLRERLAKVETRCDSEGCKR